MTKLFRGLSGIFVALILVVQTAGAQGGYVGTDRFGYNGTVSRYSSLTDAQNGTNAVSGSPFVMPERDLGLYMVDGNVGFGGVTYANSMMFLSAWYLNGQNTPTNSNYGFIQNYDEDGGSVTSMSTAWKNAEMTEFWFHVAGEAGVSGCTSPGDCGRLWNAGSASGAASVTYGIFHNYSVEFTATGLTAATWNASTEVFESNSNPTGVSGSIRGIFENTSVSDPNSNGFYVVDLDITMQSLYGAGSDSYFGSANVVPEPASFLLMAAGLAGLGFTVRQRKAV